MNKVPRVFVCIAACAFCNFTAYSQGSEDRPHSFEDRSDNGQKVHILPTPASVRTHQDRGPLDAPPAGDIAVYPASYGCGNLVDRGGFQIPEAGFQAIYWNSGVANSAATSLGYSNLKSQITAFVNAFPDNSNWDQSATDDYTIIQQYGSRSHIASSLTNNPANVASPGFPFIDVRDRVSSFTDSQVQKYLTSLFNSGKLAPLANVIYGIYFPSGMQICLSGGCSCSNFCAYHSVYPYGSTQIKYAAFPYPNCSGCMLPGRAVADMLTIVTSHEVREAVTDPGDFGTNAWYDHCGYEADDKCAWHNLYQMTRGGFWVQPEYSNGGTVTASGFTATYPGPGCVVPK